VGEVDRRGFMRILRRADPAGGKAEQAEKAEPSAKDLQIRELADLTASLLADVGTEGDEPLAEGPLHTMAYDLTYMRVTDAHVVFSMVTGFSVIVRASDITEFETQPPIEVSGYGSTVLALLRAHHPADPASVTRSYSFRFPAESPLLGAIRRAGNVEEPAEAEEAPPG
jgi:hypothetical protein